MSFKCESKLYRIQINAFWHLYIMKNYIPSWQNLLLKQEEKTSHNLLLQLFYSLFFLSKFIWQSNVHLNIMILIKRMETQPKNLISQSFFYKRKHTSHGRQKHLFEHIKLIKALCWWATFIYIYIYLCVCIIYICTLKIWSCQLNVAKLKNFKESIAKIFSCLGSSSLLPLQMN
jgi:hypothetical protein